eukprot:COSAG01_NODE_920_length_12728_cov_38.396864_20_plen_83_part_00
MAVLECGLGVIDILSPTGSCWLAAGRLQARSAGQRRPRTGGRRLQAGATAGGGSSRILLSPPLAASARQEACWERPRQPVVL